MHHHLLRFVFYIILVVSFNKVYAQSLYVKDTLSLVTRSKELHFKDNTGFKIKYRHRHSKGYFYDSTIRNKMSVSCENIAFLKDPRGKPNAAKTTITPLENGNFIVKYRNYSDTCRIWQYGNSYLALPIQEFELEWFKNSEYLEAGWKFEFFLASTDGRQVAYVCRDNKEIKFITE